MSITLERVTKHYGGVPVVNDLSLEIGDGEFFVLLGPSGSGKSTLLRAIAGLTGVDHGRIALHGRDVTRVPARKRDVGLVFQNYALFRHMSVADNIEFALRVRRVRARERRARRAELLRLVALEGLDERLPGQLSGGQQQRVAVARALAHKPEVLLLDEPFGALDAQIREELRRTIRGVQRELGITTVLVTHDQQEALAMADRIGIMNLGRLLEAGAPRELYSRPATRFVATFLGAANLILARRDTGGIRVGTALLADGAPPAGPAGQEVVAVVRPEEVAVAATGAELDCSSAGRGVVEEVVFSGALERLGVRPDPGPGGALLAAADGEASPCLQVSRAEHERRGFELRPGQPVAIGVRRAHVLPTPLSSFTACAPSAPLAVALSRHALLTELAARMRTRIAVRTEPGLGVPGAAALDEPLVGTTVIAAGADAARRTEWLLGRGAAQVLLLPAAAAMPLRVLVQWTDAAVRAATLDVAASLLRHVAAEALYLDAEDGGAAAGLAPHPDSGPAQLLIVGVAGASGLAARWRALADDARWPVLIVTRAGGVAP
ncbi:MAG TPA: ABC transporter ATP-binding protein [Steroidobacteraceae bacterium]|nr:ABC transporter ATP-binding protein [Steroidobacteraceae bacterium]